MAERVLLTGASGFLGHYLEAELRGRGLEVVTAGRRGCALTLDLGAPETIADRVRPLLPVLVLHAAAMSSLAACEAGPERAARVNTTASEQLARLAGEGLLLVSTDLAFDGDAAPYAAGDAPRPRSVYGRTKVDAETAVLAEGARVVRVPLLFGPSFDGQRGATDMIRAAGAQVALYTNEYRTPLHAEDAARGLVDALLERHGPRISHLAGGERLSRYELGERFLARAGLPLDRIRPATCHDPLRPRDVSLVSDRAAARGLDAALAAA